MKLRLLLVAAACIGACGCAAPPMDESRAMRGVERAEASVGSRPVSVSVDQTPALIIEGRRVSWETTQPMLAEAAGGMIIQELVLDEALRRECVRRGIEIAPSDLDAETARFLDMIAQGVDANDAHALLEAVRRERGLGPVRYQAMLRRSAMLRALVRDRVVINDAAVERAYLLRYGPRYDIRVLVARDAAECQQSLERIRAGAPFDGEATRVSVDPSGAAGGLLRGVSPHDIAWPQALRSMLPEMHEGETRGPVAVDDGWMLVRLERAIDTTSEAPDRATVRGEMESVARVAQERVLMDAEARRLLGGADVWVDEPLRWGWGSFRGD